MRIKLRRGISLFLMNSFHLNTSLTRRGKEGKEKSRQSMHKVECIPLSPCSAKPKTGREGGKEKRGYSRRGGGNEKGKNALQK